jgi:hypothetical protein
VPMINFRNTIRRIVPWWLQNGLAGKILYAIGAQLDTLGDAVADGVQRRFPGHGAEADPIRYDSLGLIGNERRIRRGPSETDAVYASRLPRWLDDHAARGGPYALLEQTGRYWAATPFRMDLVYRSGRGFTRDESTGAITRQDIAWSPAGDPAQWAHWWLFFFWPDAVSTDGIWTDPGTWSDGGVWDSDLTPAEVESIRLVPAEWNAQHCKGTIVLVDEDTELWDFPAGLWSDPGTWGDDLDALVQLSVD